MSATAARPCDHVLYRSVPGTGGVLLDLERREYFALDEVAAHMWEELSQTGRISDVVEAIALEYDVERAVLEDDVERFVQTLADSNLVHRTDS
jgi:RNase adaptor protein for sRNA GlmZ degradation